MNQNRCPTAFAALLFVSLNTMPGFAADEKLTAILQAAASGSPFVSLTTEDKTLRTPEPGSGEASVGPGEALYSERHQTLLKLMVNNAVLKEEFLLEGRKGVQLPVGTSLVNFTLTDPGQPLVYMRCSQAHTSIKQTVLSGAIFNSAICFREVNDFLVPRFFKKYSIPPNVRLRYELVHQASNTAMRGDGRYELLYQGVGGGVLRLTYREFTGDDLARPAFTQEVTYDMNPDGPTTILFKGAQVTILSAGNTAVCYRVETPFKH